MSEKPRVSCYSVLLYTVAEFPSFKAVIQVIVREALPKGTLLFPGVGLRT